MAIRARYDPQSIFIAFFLMNIIKVKALAYDRRLFIINMFFVYANLLKKNGSCDRYETFIHLL